MTKTEQMAVDAGAFRTQEKNSDVCYVVVADGLERLLQAERNRLADELKKMPLNDTANSIAIWIREGGNA